MPKSKQRKNHKQKVVAYKKRIEDEKKSFQKKMQALYQQQQQASLQEQIDRQNVVEGQELEGLNVEDFELGEEIEVPPLEDNSVIEEDAIIVEKVIDSDMTSTTTEES